jgi:hypothetical protein
MPAVSAPRSHHRRFHGALRMADQARRAARRLNAGAIAAMVASASFLAFSWYLPGELLSAFCLGVSFAGLIVSVLLLSYANYTGSSVSDNRRIGRLRRSIGEKRQP